MKITDSHLELYASTARSLGYKTNLIIPPLLLEVSSAQKKIYLYNTKLPINSQSAGYLSLRKDLTNKILTIHGIPTPQQYRTNHKIVLKHANALSYPVVIKPIKGAHGRGVTANITNKKELKQAVGLLTHEKSFLIEQHIDGPEYRITILDKQIIGLVKKSIPFVIGDGISTIQELANSISRLKKDEHYASMLSKQGLTENHILKSGKKAIIRQNTNGSTGGFSTTIDPQELAPKMAELLITAVQAIGLRLAALDVIIPDIRANNTHGVYVIEINSTPGLIIHHHPTFGSPQPIAIPIVKALMA